MKSENTNDLKRFQSSMQIPTWNSETFSPPMQHPLKLLIMIYCLLPGPSSMGTFSDQPAGGEKTPSSAGKRPTTQTPAQIVGNRSSTNSSDHSDRRHAQASGVGSSSSSLNDKSPFIESSRNSLDSQSSSLNSEEMKDELLSFFTAAKSR